MQIITPNKNEEGYWKGYEQAVLFPVTTENIQKIMLEVGRNDE